MIRAWLHGLREAMSRPGLILLLWLANFALALPAAWIVSDAIEDHVGASLVHQKLRDGFDMGWFSEYESSAKGLAATLHPTQTGVGAFLINLERWADGSLFTSSRSVLAVAVGFALLWAFLSGGVLARLTRSTTQDPARAGGVLQNGGRYFARFVRLALFSAPFYWLIYRLHGRMGDWLESFTRDTTAESSVLLYTLVIFAITSLLLILVHISFAYAKVATVLEDRSSMLLAALRGIGFVMSHPLATLGIHFLMLAVSGLLLGVYWLAAPGIGQVSGVAVLVAFLVGQAFLMLRMGTRVASFAAQVAYFRSRD